jgi:hypothetical protein
VSNHILLHNAALIAAVIPLIACKPSRPSPQPLGSDEVAPYAQGCKADGDCTLVDNGCCSCRTGYETVAIRTSEAAAFRAQFKCEGVPCPTSMGDACDGLSAGCDGGRCVVRRAPVVPLQIEGAE